MSGTILVCPDPGPLVTFLFLMLFSLDFCPLKNCNWLQFHSHLQSCFLPLLTAVREGQIKSCPLMAVLKTFQNESGLELAFISFIGLFYSLISEPKKATFLSLLLQLAGAELPVGQSQGTMCTGKCFSVQACVQKLRTAHFRNA